MRVGLAAAVVGLGLAAIPPARADGGRAGAVPACPSLANYRMLMRAVGDDVRTAAARLADPAADHLGCTMVARDRIAGSADHVVLEGRSYDCVAIQATNVCAWTLAGALPPPEAAAPARKAGPEKGRR